MRRAALASILATENAIRSLTMAAYERWAVVAKNAVLPTLGAAVAAEVAQHVQTQPDPNQPAQPVIPPDVAAMVTAYALWDSELDHELIPGFGALMDGLVAAALKLLGLESFKFNGDSVTAADATRVVPSLISWRAGYLASVRDRLTGTPASIQRELTTAVDRAAAGGAGPAELRRLAADELAVTPGSRWDSRADLVARTEATGIRNSAELAAAQAAQQIAAQSPASYSGAPDGAASLKPLVFEKVWLSHHDGRVRPSHMAADRQQVPLDAQFRVGVADLAFPGDPTGPPDEVANCRCSVHVVRQGVSLPADITVDTETSITAAAATGGTMGRSFEALLMPVGVPGRSGMSMLSTTAKLVDTALPLALKWQPSDEPGHDGGLTIGAIETLKVTDQGLMATGTLLDGMGGDVAMQEITAGVTRPSAELVVRAESLADDQGTTLTPDAAEQLYMDGGLVLMRMDQVEIVGATLVSVPEFRDTYITVSEAADSGAPDLALVAAAAVEPDRFDPAMFDNPLLDEPTPIHITPDGRIVGHIADWLSIHRVVKNRTGDPVHPFRSRCGYAEFHQSHVYLEPDGEILRVGRLTVGGGHAVPGRGMQAAIAHHDDVSTCWAYVRAGEDEHGIWVSGVVNPAADPVMVKQALGAPISGHWEPVGGWPELIIAHAVNNPGFAFSQTRDRDGGVAMVASFAPRQARPVIGTDVLDDVAERAVARYAEQQAGIARAAVARTLVTAASGRRKRIMADAIREAGERRGVRV